MRVNVLPIMLGCGSKPNKAVVITDINGGKSLLVCWLKKPKESKIGETVELEDVGKVICHLHFCKIEAAKAFLVGMQKMVEKWEEELKDRKEGL